MSKAITEKLKEFRNPVWAPPPAVKHGTEIVTVSVGSDKGPGGSEEFSVHRNLLMKSSTYFRAAISHFREGVENRIELMEVIPQAFQVFYSWLYTGNVDEQEGEEYETDHFWLLVFQMADHLMVAGLKVIAYGKFRACFEPT
ncbi:hypothetical protein H2198_003202 [Neophaeococcomyces mojaviensis]|uniref:Uncharacterized protein n=1 Tax=Neophaeococcomyces mojaviensis TaxID=3383035 RepID=A0ACC3AC57_9EURO|nr:hypothetical protein H2198_003202 [Knufia sp. JES_112]